MKKSVSNNSKGSPPKSNSKDNLNEKSNLPKSKGDIESVNSAIVKMQEFLNDHDLSCNPSISDAVQPLESSSFPLNYKNLEKEQKEQKEANRISEIKKALESKRSDFEEIRMHLEKRAEEIKKRVKTLKVSKSDEKDKKESSGILSYHSTEFSADYNSNIMPFKKNELLSNKERLKLFTDKQMHQKESNEQNLKKANESNDYRMTHAIFAHLAKLKNIKKVCDAYRSKENHSVKSREEAEKKSKETLVKESNDNFKKGKEIMKKSKEDSIKLNNLKKNKDVTKTNAQVKDQFLSREDSDPDLILGKNKSLLRSDSCTSIKSRFSDEDDA